MTDRLPIDDEPLRHAVADGLLHAVDLDMAGVGDDQAEDTTRRDPNLIGAAPIDAGILISREADRR